MVSDREYRKTSRGIDIITSLLAEKGHFIDHMVFFRRKRIPEKQITSSIKQIYFFDFLGLYRDKMRIFMPGFLLLFYFSYIIKKQKDYDFSVYDWVILESGYSSYLSLILNNKIIYRISDPPEIAFNTMRRFYEKLELNTIKKSAHVMSAISADFYPCEYKDKIFFWHSGYTAINTDEKTAQKKEFIFMGGGEIDFSLIKNIVINFPDYTFHIIGSFKKKIKHNSVVFHGYLDYNEYQRIILNSSVCIVPFTIKFANQLKRCYFTAKVLLPMSLGMPVLIKSYGKIKETDYDKKLFVYNTHKEAITLLKEILEKKDKGIIKHDVSRETSSFLSIHTAENRIIELNSLLSKWLS